LQKRDEKLPGSSPATSISLLSGFILIENNRGIFGMKFFNTVSIDIWAIARKLYPRSVLILLGLMVALLNILILYSLGENLQPRTVYAAVTLISPTPTIDRLAEPTLPAEPGQADRGAQAFWLNCLPCHGDRGQGLTDEFRALYPEEDRNCWNSGCHGAHPYEGGWTLPTVVPEIIGRDALHNFNTAATLHNFISSAMPYQAPGTLDDDTYWQLTAFLLRENRIQGWREPLDTANAPQIDLAPPTNQEILSTSTPSVSGDPNPALTSSPAMTGNHQISQRGQISPVLLILVGLILIGITLAWLVPKLSH
jgi:mono/diheme cytochrome c family protein